MNVINKLAYRVISLNKVEKIAVGDILPIPAERTNCAGTQMKNETENLFEEVRKESFPLLPSRKSVLFVLPYNKAFVDGWVSLHNPHNDYDYALLTLRLTGSIIWCEENKFSDAGILPSCRKVYAKKYWEGACDDFNKFEIPEGLFRGTAQVEVITEEHYISPYK